jgi:hypothetical protein
LQGRFVRFSKPLDRHVFVESLSGGGTSGSADGARRSFCHASAGGRSPAVVGRPFGRVELGVARNAASRYCCGSQSRRQCERALPTGCLRVLLCGAQVPRIEEVA